jgi:hypothetical protein
VIHTVVIRTIVNQTIIFQGEKTGLVVRAEDSPPRDCGFESCRILDNVSDAS